MGEKLAGVSGEAHKESARQTRRRISHAVQALFLISEDSIKTWLISVRLQSLKPDVSEKKIKNQEEKIQTKAETGNWVADSKIKVKDFLVKTRKHKRRGRVKGTKGVIKEPEVDLSRCKLHKF